MLSYMRKHQRSFIIYLVFGIIIVVFVAYFGPQSRGCFTTLSYAAKVNGKIITEDEFNFAHNTRFRAMQEQDPDFDHKAAEKMRLRELVMDQLVSTYLLSHAAKKYGLVVTEEELRESIFEIPIFQVNGKFDVKLYERYVNYFFRTSLPAFEARQRKILLAQKMLDTLRESIQISEMDARAEFESNSNRVNLYFIRVDPAKFKKKVAVSSEEIDEAINSRYPDLENYYTKHITQYKTPEEVRARHILVKIDEDAEPPVTEEDAKKNIEKIKEELERGADFAELAKKYSECPSAAKGGDLGFFKRGQMDREFEKVAFSLEPNETSDPVKSAFGFHIIKVEEKKPASETPLRDVEKEVAEKMLMEERSHVAAKDKADQLFERLGKGEKITSLAPLISSEKKEKKGKAPELAVEETGFFAKGGPGYIPKIGIDQQLMQDAFKLTSEKPVPEKVYEVTKRFFVISLKDREFPDMKKFEQEKSSIIERLRTMKVGSILEKWLQQQRERARIEINPNYLVYSED